MCTSEVYNCNLNWNEWTTFFSKVKQLEGGFFVLIWRFN